MYCDASGKLGYAVVLGSQWFAYKWKYQHERLLGKERFPVVLALENCVFKLWNHKILFFSDNKSVVDTINKETNKKKYTVIRHC